MFIVVKKKTIILIAATVVFLIAAAIICAVAFSADKTASVGQKVIVIDAGHGGSDNGVVSKNGTKESVVNLKIAEKLKAQLEEGGFFVVMTRTTDKGADEVGSFKQEDFRKRKAIVEKACPDMLVSVHCNKFPSSDRRGAQVFYNKLSDEGKNLADVLQKSVNGLNSIYTGRTFDALSGDYFMLNLTRSPSVIVECGFLSNEEDEALLCSEDYIDKLVYTLYDGVVAYFEQ